MKFEVVQQSSKKKKIENSIIKAFDNFIKLNQEEMEKAAKRKT